MAIRLSPGLANFLARTGNLKEALSTGFIYFFSGTQPAGAHLAASGTLLAVISADGAGTTGLTLVDGDDTGQVKKDAAQDWEGDGIAAGTAGWYRYQELDTNEATTRTNALAASTITKRVDGSIATSGADLNVTNTTVAVGPPSAPLPTC
jgi:flagellin-like hook-associated protein FlgL